MNDSCLCNRTCFLLACNKSVACGQLSLLASRLHPGFLDDLAHIWCERCGSNLLEGLLIDKTEGWKQTEFRSKTCVWNKKDLELTGIVQLEYVLWS
jgi:hypothetical protein